MSDAPLPDFVIVGPQKCATTWMYECLYEHPEILMPEVDAVNYFNMNYHRGLEWYRDFFSAYDGETLVGEETPQYIRGEEVPERMAETLSDPKLVFCIRNPVDRAFSHWWHYKGNKQWGLSFEFERCLDLYDLFQNWVTPGFYYRHLTRYLEHFPEENLKLCFFDDLVEDDLAYIQDVYSFLGVEDDFVPPTIGEKVNEGQYRSVWSGSLYGTVTDAYKRFAPQTAVELARPVDDAVKELLSSQSEYEKGMSDEMQAELEAIFADDVRKLADYTGRDLDHWFEFTDL